MLHFLASFRGRISRLHYWLLMLCGLAILLLAAIIGSLNLGNEPVQWLSYAILLLSGVPILSGTIRRLHDLNLSKWTIALFMLVTGALQLLAIGSVSLSNAVAIVSGALTVISVIGLGAVAGTKGPNRYGDD